MQEKSVSPHTLPSRRRKAVLHFVYTLYQSQAAHLRVYKNAQAQSMHRTTQQPQKMNPTITNTFAFLGHEFAQELH